MMSNIIADVYLDGIYLLRTLMTSSYDYKYLEYVHDARIAVTVNQGNKQEIRMFSILDTDGMFI